MNIPLPMISVVVPVYNEEKEISELLDSLMLLEWPRDRLEILCVDNNSTDRSLEILGSYPITVLQETKPGPYAARNLAIRKAKGEFIALTDADCKVTPNWLLELWQSFDDEQVGAVGGVIIPRVITNYVDYFEGCVFNNPNHGLGSKEVQPYVITANVMYRKEVFDELGLFDEDNFSGPDVEMSWRLIRSNKYTIKILDREKGMVYHRYRTRFRDLTYVLQRDAYGWFYLTSNNPDMAPVPQPWKYFFKVLRGLVVYPLKTLFRLVMAPLRQTPLQELPQDLMRLVVLWHHFLGTWNAKLAYSGWQAPRMLR
jgi:glycosyltransferase involved in cell wall biosynthesis